MSFIGRLWNAFRNPVRYVGRDLQGNKFFESRCPNNPNRPRRIVKYFDEEEVWHYIGGRKRLPAQWSAWLAHTRRQPPSIEELQADLLRQQRLADNVAQIEARDRAEAEERLRIRQEDNRLALEAAAMRMSEPAQVQSRKVESPSPAPPSEASASSSSSGAASASQAPDADADLPAFLTPATPRKSRPSQGAKFTIPILNLETEDSVTPANAQPQPPAKSLASAEEPSPPPPKPSSTLPYMPSRPLSETESWAPKMRRRG